MNVSNWPFSFSIWLTLHVFNLCIVFHRFGKGTRTVDVELEGQIEALRDTQKKYANILRLARALTNHFYHVVQTQRALGMTWLFFNAA